MAPTLTNLLDLDGPNALITNHLAAKDLARLTATSRASRDCDLVRWGALWGACTHPVRILDSNPWDNKRVESGKVRPKPGMVVWKPIYNELRLVDIDHPDTDFGEVQIGGLFWRLQRITRTTVVAMPLSAQVENGVWTFTTPEDQKTKKLSGWYVSLEHAPCTVDERVIPWIR